MSHADEKREYDALMRHVAFAIWWKLAVVMALWFFASRFVIAFLAGFLGFIVPMRQLQFWIVVQASNLFGERAGQYLLSSPPAVQSILGALVIFASTLADLAVLFLTLHWLLARHVGRDLGRVRLAHQSVP